VGEAMSHGVPVVTTRFGAEGFGLTPNVHLLVADTPNTFADAILQLLNDTKHHHTISENGHSFIKAHYSPQSMQTQLAVFLEKIKPLTPIRPTWKKRIFYYFEKSFNQHIRWRFK
jgi:glycosyltransferase involved in cell wall biosynthesis